MSRARLYDRTDSGQVIKTLDRLVEEAGGDPETLSGQLIRQMMHTALKFCKDAADNGELKIISRGIKELRHAMRVFRPYQHVHKISIFGSARTSEDHVQYQSAVQFSRLISEAGWMVITGAGSGIMQAGNVGPGREASFGVAIRLPFETSANQIIAGDEKLVTFRYFFNRKLMFVKEAEAVALFPGGIGTLDECFEVLTLVQTGKAATIPIVMVDAPGGDYWIHWDRYVRDQLLDNGMISSEDLNLYYITDQPQKAVDHVLRFYRNYHSQRYVGDFLVIRLNQAPTDKQIDQLNDQFKDLVAEGRIEKTTALDGEHAHLDLPRLKFVFSKRSYGRLRLFIDRLNDFAE